MKNTSRLYAYLKRLAQNGLPCPRNADIAQAIGLTHDQVSNAFGFLRDEHRIETRRCGNRRIVTLLGTKLETADPRPVETVTVRPLVRDIVAAAAIAFDTTEKDIASRSRFHEHVIARKAVCATAWARGWSSPEIGRVLGGRDHSTILHHRDTAARLRATSSDFARRLAVVEAQTPQPREVQL